MAASTAPLPIRYQESCPEATSGAFEDNGPSYAVSLRHGYEPDGVDRHVVRGKPVTTRRLRLSRARWEEHRTVRVTVDGLAPCLPMFGLPET